MIPYEKISLISEKEHNKVWLASAKGFDSPVIVKEITDANIDVLNCIATIDNSHIPHTLSMETINNITLIMEEYVSGLPLDDYVKENNLVEHEVIDLILQICDGIKALHAQTPSIIHRDLKPSNLLVSSDGIVKIIDFDACRKYKEAAETDTRNLGTVAFAPPEQYGYSQTDVRSDIYSLGAVMYELFFEEQLPKTTPENTLDNKILYPSEHKIHKKLIRIIEKCTMFNPSARYKNIAEVQRALLTYTSSIKKPLLILFIATFAVLTCVGSSIALNENSEKNTTKQSYTTTPIPAIISGEASPILPTETIEPFIKSTTTPTIKSPIDKTKTMDKKSKIADIPKNKASTNPNVSNPKNTNSKTITNSKSISTKKSNNKKKLTKTSNPTATPVPYTGNITEYYIDTYNSKTNSTETFTYYYMKNKPELTPINIACGLLDNYPPQAVYIQNTTQASKIKIPKKYWSLSNNHIVSISDIYLSTLKLNYTYQIIFDCREIIIISKLAIINDLNKIAYPFNQFTVSPGYVEYLHDNPCNIALAITNGFGRKITKIINWGTNKKVATKYYTLDNRNGYLIFKKAFFENFSSGTYINLRIYHSQVKGIDDNGYTDHCFLVKHSSYTAPQILSTTFTYFSNAPKDLTLKMNWNDGRGKLMGIYPIDNTMPILTETDYTTTPSSIIIKKEFLAKLEKGNYDYQLEFGTVAIVITLNIE